MLARWLPALTWAQNYSKAEIGGDLVAGTIVAIMLVPQAMAYALESLETLTDELKDAGVTVHLAEVKGPVMDQFERSTIIEHLQPGRVFLSTHDAIQSLGRPHTAASAVSSTQ